MRQSRKSLVGDGSGLATQALENADDIPESGASMTELLVKSTKKQLFEAYESNDRQPLSYFLFVLDPTSFCKTVENIFHLSFLIKENCATIFIGNSLHNTQFCTLDGVFFIIEVYKRQILRAQKNHQKVREKFWQDFFMQPKFKFLTIWYYKNGHLVLIFGNVETKIDLRL